MNRVVEYVTPMSLLICEDSIQDFERRRVAPLRIKKLQRFSRSELVTLNWVPRRHLSTAFGTCKSYFSGEPDAGMSNTGEVSPSPLQGQLITL